MNKLMQRLGDAVYRASIESGASAEESERFKTFPWQVFILNADQPNAFSASGGVLFVTRGLFLELETEASFAAVIAHEMAHELMGHAADLADRQSGENGPSVAFTLQHEIEADAVSVALLRLARYNPREILHAISAMAQSRARSANPEQQQWAAERASQLNQLLAREIPQLPSTTNSRDYNVIRERIRTHSIPTTR